MNSNLTLAFASSLASVFINILVHGLTWGALGAFITAFLFCIILFYGIDYVDAHFRKKK